MPNYEWKFRHSYCFLYSLKSLHTMVIIPCEKKIREFFNCEQTYQIFSVTFKVNYILILLVAIDMIFREAGMCLLCSLLIEKDRFMLLSNVPVTEFLIVWIINYIIYSSNRWPFNSIPSPVLQKSFIHIAPGFSLKRIKKSKVERWVFPTFLEHKLGLRDWKEILPQRTSFRRLNDKHLWKPHFGLMQLVQGENVA